MSQNLLDVKTNEKLRRISKIYPCPKLYLKPVTPVTCEQCEIVDSCPTPRLTASALAQILPHDVQHQIYDIWTPEQLQLDVERSNRRIMWARVGNLLKPDWKLLDLGCGTGRFAKVLEMMRFKGKYVGIDWSRERIKEAKKYVPAQNYKFLVGDIFNPKLYKKMASFDAVLLLEFLQVVKSQKLINDFFHEFPKGGTPIMIFTTPRIPSFLSVRLKINSLRTLGYEIDFFEKFDGAGFNLYRAKRK